jgi:hypothetical protein
MWCLTPFWGGFRERGGALFCGRARRLIPSERCFGRLSVRPQAQCPGASGWRGASATLSNRLNVVSDTFLGRLPGTGRRLVGNVSLTRKMRHLKRKTRRLIFEGRSSLFLSGWRIAGFHSKQRRAVLRLRLATSRRLMSLSNQRKEQCAGSTSVVLPLFFTVLNQCAYRNIL